METASLQLAAQQELERARHQASEALRAMDAERQQLRTVNNKWVYVLVSVQCCRVHDLRYNGASRQMERGSSIEWCTI